MRAKLRPKARADLDSIWDYTADRWGEDQADSYVQQIRRTIERFTASTSTSSDAAYLFPGLRKERAGSHLVYFLVGEQIDVVRVLHERQDARSNLN